MKKKDEVKDTPPEQKASEEHSLLCHEGLFYEGLRAIAEDTEKN